MQLINLHQHRARVHAQMRPFRSAATRWHYNINDGKMCVCFKLSFYWKRTNIPNSHSTVKQQMPLHDLTTGLKYVCCVCCIWLVCPSLLQNSSQSIWFFIVCAVYGLPFIRHSFLLYFVFFSHSFLGCCLILSCVRFIRFQQTNLTYICINLHRRMNGLALCAQNIPLWCGQLKCKCVQFVQYIRSMCSHCCSFFPYTYAHKWPAKMPIINNWLDCVYAVIKSSV